MVIPIAAFREHAAKQGETHNDKWRFEKQPASVRVREVTRTPKQRRRRPTKREGVRFLGQATLTHSPAHRQAAMAPPERYRRSQHRYPGGERRARTPPKQRHVRRRRHTSTETITAPNERTHRQRCSRATRAHEQRVELVVDVPSEVRHRLHYPSERTQSPGVARNRRRPQVQRSVGGRRRRRLETGQSVRVCVPYHGSFLRCRQSALAGAPRFALSPAMLGERGNCTSRDRFGGPGGWRPVQPVTHRLLRHP